MLVYLFNATNRKIVETYDWKALLGKDYGYLCKLHGESFPAGDVHCVRIPHRSGVLFFTTAEPMAEESSNLRNW